MARCLPSIGSHRAGVETKPRSLSAAGPLAVRSLLAFHRALGCQPQRFGSRLISETNKLGFRAQTASSESWETAYVNFETPQEETRKFTRRLKKLGALDWSRDAAVLELFCGRGSGLRA